LLLLRSFCMRQRPPGFINVLNYDTIAGGKRSLTTKVTMMRREEN